jgi:Arc/MetJ-type ribon-helix-helix transcriptional regulator
MSKELTVRLPDDLVDFIDGRVRAGEAPSRAAVISAAVERERRRAIAERDAGILAAAPGADDLDELAAYAARTRLNDLD